MLCGWSTPCLCACTFCTIWCAIHIDDICFPEPCRFAIGAISVEDLAREAHSPVILGPTPRCVDERRHGHRPIMQRFFQVPAATALQMPQLHDTINGQRSTLMIAACVHLKADPEVHGDDLVSARTAWEDLSACV